MSRVVCTPPVDGAKYFWLRHPRSLCIVTVKSALDLRLEVKFYRGYDNDFTQEVTWTQEEWDAAAGKTLIDYWPPVKKEDLGPDEELCHSCNGDGFEQERDLEMMLCIWCEDGKRKKSPPIPQPTQRSGLHPTLPPK